MKIKNVHNRTSLTIGICLTVIPFLVFFLTLSSFTNPTYSQSNSKDLYNTTADITHIPGVRNYFDSIFSVIKSSPDTTAITVEEGSERLSAGTVTIKKGDTGVGVLFNDHYAVYPIITLTVDTTADIQVAVSTIDSEGFTISLSNVQSRDVDIYWTAYGEAIEHVIVADVEPMVATMFVDADVIAGTFVVEKDSLKFMPIDVEVPYITLEGNNPAYIELGITYTDSGAYGIDNLDGAIDVVATVNGDYVGKARNIFIDTSLSATHHIIYQSTDQAGNVGYASRTVIVGSGDRLFANGS